MAGFSTLREACERVLSRVNHSGINDNSFNFDSEVHRFKDPKTPHSTKKPFWAIGHTFVFDNQYFALILFGDWRSGGEPEKIISWDARHINKKYKQEIKDQEIKILQRSEDIKRQRKVQCKNECQILFTTLSGESVHTHPYIVKKDLGIQSRLSKLRETVKLTENNLFIPMYIRSQKGNMYISGAQYISPKGQKWFHTGSDIKSAFFSIKPMEELSLSKVLYIAEGFATALSVQSATEHPVVCCFTAQNIEAILLMLRELNPNAKIIILGDRDKLSKLGKKTVRPGAYYAEKASLRDSNCLIAYPWDEERLVGDFSDLFVEDDDKPIAVRRRIEMLEEDKKEELVEFTEDKFEELIKKGFTTFNEKGHLTRQTEEFWAYLDSKLDPIYSAEQDNIYVKQKNIPNLYKKIPDWDIRGLTEKYFKAPVKRSLREEMVQMVKSKGIQKKVKSFDQSNIICFKNGLLNAETDKFIEGESKDKFFLKHKPYDFKRVREINCPTYDALLKNIITKPESIETFDEFIAFSFFNMPNTFAQKMLCLYGSGNNGKSTLINVIKMLFGDDDVSFVDVRDFEQRFAIGSIIDKALNISEEVTTKDLKRVSVLKNVIGGGELSVEEKFKPAYRRSTNVKLILSFNEFPEITDTTKGFKRRFLLIPMERDLEKEPYRKIQNIYEKIHKERSEIVARLYEAYVRLNERGYFREIEGFEEIYDEQLAFSDPVYDFYRTHCEKTLDDVDSQSTDAIYQKFLEHFPDSGIQRNRFFRRFSVLHGMKSELRGPGTSRYRAYTNIIIS